MWILSTNFFLSNASRFAITRSLVPDIVPYPVATQQLSDDDLFINVTDVPDVVELYIVRIYVGENVDTRNEATEEVSLTRNENFMHEFANLLPGRYIATVQAQAGLHYSDIFTLPEFDIGTCTM